MVHILCHNVAADSSGSSKHNKKSYQLVGAKAHAYGYGKKNSRLQNQLYKGTNQRWLYFGQRFFLQILPGPVNERMITAATLYRGTVSMIIRGAMPALP